MKPTAGAATGLVEYMQAHKIVFANSDTTMNVANVRLHLRVLRRLSMAVADTGSPAYADSALFFFDRNEEIFGRKGQQTLLQESARAFDSFQSALQSLDELRMASENLHILLLRGCNIKMSGRQIPELARGLVLYSKVPQALIPRFPRYAEFLKDFQSLKVFHAQFPVGLTVAPLPHVS